MRFATLSLLISLLAWAASAQTRAHLYGGYTLLPKDGSNAVVAGGGAEAGRFYFAGDGHGLRPTDKLREEFSREVGQSLPEGFSVSAKASGFDVAAGAAVATSDRFALIPVGIVGWTSGDTEFCFEDFCDSESLTDVNFGGGLVARVSASSGVGLHVGIRFTRNYGAALTVGIVFTRN